LPLINSYLKLVASLDILMLRREEPGSLILQGGDIDNRIKTLLDSLRVPKGINEIPNGDSPLDGEKPFFYCLLEDDALVTDLTIRTDRLLLPGNDTNVVLVIDVLIRGTGAT